MELNSRRKLIIGGGLVAAVMLGWDLGNGSYFLPGIVLAGALLLVANRATNLPADALVMGFVLMGYLIGNRGFAQLSIPGLPILPGEAALALGLAFAVARFALAKFLPVRRDAMNFLLLVWIAIGTGRLMHDGRIHGFMAIRDFALVYYALFFFLAQGWATMPAARTWIERSLTFGFAGIVPVTTAFNLWPEALSRINVAGVPLIFIKGDVAGSFMAAGLFWFGSKFAAEGHRRWMLLMTLCAAGLAGSNSRAALLAGILGGLTLLVLREKRLVRVFGQLAALGALFLAADAVWPREPGQYSRGFRLYESMLSITDFSGTRVPLSTDLGDKPDNNQFRIVWWDAVIHETLEEGPLLGLGFGHDLASGFVRRYYPTMDEEFNTRSPHNFLITIFARMGAVGLAVFLAVLGTVAARTWRAAMAAPDSGAGARWLPTWMILFAACFGVVLEGPMGAVVFWTLLGLASATTATSAETAAVAEAPDPALPADAPQREFAPVP